MLTQRAAELAVVEHARANVLADRYKGTTAS
jgi:hypothetical protein